MHRQKKLAVGGEDSDWIPVQYNISQITVLDPIPFLVYINESSKHITYNVQLYADDRPKNYSDAVPLQTDEKTIAMQSPYKQTKKR